MELNGDYTFDAPQHLVWEALNDPNVLGSVMPGSEGFEEIGENEYAGKLKVRVGPVQGNFEATITLTEINEPDSYTLSVDGKGAAGNVSATGGMNLKPEGDDKTYMEYAGTAQITGRIASVGQRLMDSTARSIVRQSLTALNEYLKVEVAKQAPAMPETKSTTEDTGDSDEPASAPPVVDATTPIQPETPPVPEFTPPSQMEIGMNVMRDVLDDFVPKQFQPLLLGGVIVIIVLILWRVIF